ncbi:MAG: plastocyanin/azurin family copper-binding protein [Acidimicrobiia bacterium]
MTDETSDSGSVATDPGPAEAAPAVVEAAAVEPVPATPVPFWQRPNVERYVVPLMTPILVVVGIVVYVLNLSRVFLSAHGHTSIIVGTCVTVIILLGSTVLSNSSRLRSTSIALMTAAFLLLIFGSGWLVLGHSQLKGTNSAVLTATGPSQGSFTITAQPGAALSFGPSSLSAKTGIYSVTLHDGANTTHTLNFDQTSTLWAGLVVNSQGEKLTSRIFFPTAGDYTYYCAVTGHRAAGMQGVIHVTGPTLTLAQAEAAGKPTGGTGGT